jgi:pyruvate dehydrogenase E2 component (dihydrolipoamide acetyltransferase)
MTKGTITEWLKKEGDDVRENEVIAIVEGEKTIFEITSPYSGKLKKIFVKSGEEVEVGQPICEIETEGPHTYLEKTEEQKAVMLAADEKSMLAHIEGAERKVPFAGIRKAITRKLSPGFHETLPVALMTKFIADELIRHKEKTKASFTAYAIKASALALQKHNDINVTLIGEELIYRKEINIAVAIHTQTGLTAPVIKDADKLSLQELTKIIDEYQEKSEKNKITLEEQTSHSFTVTNLGHLGILYFTPIINPPDPAILALGSIETELHPNDNGSPAPRKVGYLTLVFDHRIIDGVPAAKFLASIKEFLEKPETMETTKEKHS